MQPTSLPTQAEMLDALRKLLWAYACVSSQMLRSPKNPQPGLMMLGLPVCVTDDFAWANMPEAWDISSYPITSSLTTIHEYVTTGRWYASNNWIDLATSTLMFIDGLENFFVLDETALPWRDERTICFGILAAGHARHRLDEGEYLTLKEISLLANMDEKSVRNAANPKSKDPLITESEGNRTYVSPSAANEWLSRRRGFIASVQIQEKADERPLRVAAFSDEKALASFIRSRCARLKVDIKSPRLTALSNGDLRHDLPFLHEVTTILNLDSESFIRAFVELTLKVLSSQPTAR